MGCYFWYNEEGPGRPVTVHPSTASVLHDDPLLCGFNVAIKGLNMRSSKTNTKSYAIYRMVLFTMTFISFIDPEFNGVL